MASNDVTDLNEAQVWQRLYGKKLCGRAQPRLKVGQKVQLSQKHPPFKKAYLPGWTEEVFVMQHLVPGLVTTYQVKEWDGMLVKGQFYKEDLQPVTVPDDALFRLEKILQRRGTQVKVRWMGWPSKYGSWIPKLALTNRHRPKGRSKAQTQSQRSIDAG